MDRPLACPLGKIARKGVNSEKPFLLDRLRSAGAAESRGAVRGDRHQGTGLIECLDHRRQQFRRRSPAGGDDGAGSPGFHGPAERKKPGAAFLEVPPNPDEARRFGTGKRLDQGRIARPGTDDKLTNTRPQAAFHHINRRIPCIHAASASPSAGQCPSARLLFPSAPPQA